jgi:uncharacterized RDD family membrane protein YckC
MDRNPYDPPKSDLEQPAAPPGQLELAPRGLRLANMLIDAVAQAVTGFVIFALVGIVDAGLLNGLASDESPLSSYVIGICVSLLYYVPLESLSGRTLGKLVTRTRVVDESGNPPAFGRVLGRTLLRLVPFEAFTFLGRTGVGLHDSASRTRVVRDPRNV